MIESLNHKAIKELIEGYVLSRFNVTISDLFGQSRQKEIVQARFVYWWLLRNKLQYSLPGIGRLFGKDHTTILSGLRSIKKIGLDVKLKEDLGSKVLDIKVKCEKCGHENSHRLSDSYPVVVHRS